MLLPYTTKEIFQQCYRYIAACRYMEDFGLMLPSSTEIHKNTHPLMYY